MQEQPEAYRLHVEGPTLPGASPVAVTRLRRVYVPVPAKFTFVLIVALL